MKGPVVGLDLGTTHTVIGVWQQQEPVNLDANDAGSKIKECVTIVRNQGQATIPSYVAFSNTDILVGAPAKNYGNKKNAIFDSKRVIGRTYTEVVEENNIELWPFKVFDKNGYPYFQIEVNNEVNYYSAEEIAKYIIMKAVKLAEEKLGEPITHIVISVPAYFNNRQRLATIEAAKLAEVTVLRLINEPTAAALGYGIKYLNKSDKTVLVYDLGGGTIDVSLLTLHKNGVYQVIATEGNSQLGGEDFNNTMVEYCLIKFKEQHDIDLKTINNASVAIQRIRDSCESAKHQLSSYSTADIVVHNIFQDITLSITMTRSDFEKECNDYFLKTMKLVNKVLLAGKIVKDKVDDVILVGGSTRIEKIREMLNEYFNKKVNITLDPDEAIAFGATIYAASLNNILPKIKLLDVIPLSLGIGLKNDVMSTLIKKDCVKPYKASKVYTTSYDYQESIKFRVYEGEKEKASLNHLLGEFILNNIPKMLAGQPQVLVSFDILNDLHPWTFSSAYTFAYIIFESLEPRIQKVYDDLRSMNVPSVADFQYIINDKICEKGIEFAEENDENRGSLTQKEIKNYRKLLSGKGAAQEFKAIFDHPRGFLDVEQCSGKLKNMKFSFKMLEIQNYSVEKVPINSIPYNVTVHETDPSEAERRVIDNGQAGADILFNFYQPEENHEGVIVINNEGQHCGTLVPRICVSQEKINNALLPRQPQSVYEYDHETQPIQIEPHEIGVAEEEEEEGVVASPMEPEYEKIGELSKRHALEQGRRPGRPKKVRRGRKPAFSENSLVLVKYKDSPLWPALITAREKSKYRVFFFNENGLTTTSQLLEKAYLQTYSETDMNESASGIKDVNTINQWEYTKKGCKSYIEKNPSTTIS